MKSTIKTLAFTIMLSGVAMGHAGAVTGGKFPSFGIAPVHLSDVTHKERMRCLNGQWPSYMYSHCYNVEPIGIRVFESITQ